MIFDPRPRSRQSPRLPRPFPTVEGRNLAGRDFVVPRDLPGRSRLLLLAFQQRQQRLVNTWLAVLDEVADQVPGFRFFELPVLATPWRLIRGFIDGGMASGIGDPVALARTITVYTDRDRFLEAAGIEGAGTIAVLLLDPEGRIVWEERGALTKGKLASLRRALAG